MTNGFVTQQRENASRWKSTTLALTDAARASAPYAGRGCHDFCLPEEHASANLLPAIRDTVLSLFADLDIRWHRGVGTGPTNHLLSSQVQCVNAMAAMVADPER